MFSDSYLTITAPSQGLYKDRGSKFLAFAFPVTSETEIKSHLAELRNKHASARHHCYAWRLGADKTAFRSNDDGEPSGTAGKPIFNQLLARDLTNILIVVVRYFGGTLLGVSGLAQAYKSASADAIQNASIIEKFINFEYTVEFEATDMNSVMRVLKEHMAKIISNEFNERCVIVFHIKKGNSGKLEEKFATIYRSKLTFNKMT